MLVGKLDCGYSGIEKKTQEILTRLKDGAQKL